MRNTGLPRCWVSWRDERGQTGDTRMKQDEAIRYARQFKTRRRWALVIDTATCKRLAEYGTPFSDLPPMQFHKLIQFRQSERSAA
jgi:hypothetical protein